MASTAKLRMVSDWTLADRFDVVVLLDIRLWIGHPSFFMARSILGNGYRIHYHVDASLKESDSHQNWLGA